MKHIALRARSVRKQGKAYTAPGLGDRIHGVTTGWVYSQAHNTPVTIHLTQNKTEGGQFGNKLESWAEIVKLFPEGSAQIQAHNYEPQDEKDWVEFLNNKGYAGAEIYYYKDHIGRYESVEKIDISQYLKNIPLLTPELVDIQLPEKFITVQWDSNDAKRTISPAARKEVLAKYIKEGYEVVVVGGEATDKDLRWSLKHIAYAMSKATFHVGVDSAFMHLAMLYFPWERIHLYNEQKGMWSHHMLRALDNGAKLNHHYYKIKLGSRQFL